eukprot:augustus_masked-scaffold_4-processed-gene-6.53-mRNA-1 protein AED:1.00 eAED:1.00 QI:0/0/0/0/1/1/2/0/345
MSGNNENLSMNETAGTGTETGRTGTMKSNQINTLLIDLGNVLREVSRNNRREEECCMDFEIEKLNDISKQSCELFITQYEQVNTVQKKRINLNLRMDMSIFKHLKRLNVTKSSNFNWSTLEESGVKAMFSEVRGNLKLLSEESAKSKKKICSSIFRLFPIFTWARNDMLTIRPSLCSLDLKELEEYILDCILPYHVRLKIRKGKVYEDDIKNRVSGNRFIKKKARSMEVNEKEEVGCRNMNHVQDPEIGNCEEVDLCPFCHRYGYSEDVYYAKRDLIASGKQNLHLLYNSGDGVMKKSLKRFRERQKLRQSREKMSHQQAVQRVEENITEIDETEGGCGNDDVIV